MTLSKEPPGLSRRSATIWRDLQAEHKFERHEIATLRRSLEWLDRSDALLAAADAAVEPRERAGLLKAAMDASTCGLRFWRALKFVDPVTKRRPGRPPADEWSALRRQAG